MKSVVYVWACYTLHCMCVITSRRTWAAAAEENAGGDYPLFVGTVVTAHEFASSRKVTAPIATQLHEPNFNTLRDQHIMWPTEGKGWS